TRLALGLGVVQPEPLVATSGVVHLLADAERVVLMEEEDGRRLFLDELLDLRIDLPPPRLVQDRARLVDHRIEALDPGVPLADPAAGLGVIQRVEDRVSVEDGVVAPAAVEPVGRLALALEELVPRRARVPDLGGG